MSATEKTTADLLAFLQKSPTPYHATAEAAARLGAAGFVEKDPRTSWSGLAAGRYFVVHGGTSLVAFVVPTSRKVDGFRIVGAHTDSPNLRVKPNGSYVKEGYAQLGVEVYGGALLNSWLDRDLGLAGRAVLRGTGGALVFRDFVVDRPILRVAQLAIHLDRDVNEKGVVLNRQEHLAPIFGQATGIHDLPSFLAKELGVDAKSLVSTDAMLFDLTAPTLGGPNREFLFSARLDNLAMCHAGTIALVAGAAAAEGASLVPVLALFDHEEVGSESQTGAGSALLPRILERIVLGLGGSADDVHRVLSSSACVSADMAHAVHPNYEGRHEPRHKPVLNGGPVLKVNAQQRYATSVVGAAVFAELCREAEVPMQKYAHRTDLPCGSTIGPITSTHLGIPTIDVGNPMLSMHSSREMAGSADPDAMTRVLGRFFATTARM
ncbi:MAG: M18 family aminopeptidase [Polyangiaceae bacterium]